MATPPPPSNQNSPKNDLKFRFKLNPNRLSLNKVAGSAATNGSEPTGTEPCPFSDPSQPHKESPEVKFRVESSNGNTDISNHYSMVKEGTDAESLTAGEINASEPNPSCKAVVDSQVEATQASVDQHAVINSNTSRVPGAAEKDKKKRRFSVTLPREEIEEDVAAIEALSGGKRLRRPRRPRSNAHQRRLDRLFPGLEYLGFH